MSWLSFLNPFSPIDDRPVAQVIELSSQNIDWLYSDDKEARIQVEKIHSFLLSMKKV